jgi:hypothetical protein
MNLAMETLHPTAGVRVHLELADFDAGGAGYRAAVFTPTSRFDYHLRVALPDGRVSFVDAPEEAAAGYSELVHGMARMLVRDALSSEPLTWPRRLLRWRDK